MTRPAKLDAHDLRRVAVEAGCDPRTVTRHLDGEPVRGPVKARIADALRKLGLVPAPPKDVTLRCGACGDETQAHEGAYSPKCSRCGGVRRVLGLDAEPAPGIAAGPEIAILPRTPSSYAASRTSPVVALDAEPAPREEQAR